MYATLNPQPEQKRRPQAAQPVPKRTQTFYDDQRVSFYERHGRRQHCYVLENTGHFIPGVTTALKRLDKPALLQWASNSAISDFMDGLPTQLHSFAEEVKTTGNVDLSVKSFMSGPLKEAADYAKQAFVRKRDEGAAIGSAAHSLIERAFVGDDIAPDEFRDPRVKAAFDAAREWLGSHDVEPLNTERMLYSKRWFYAGTCDLFARIDGELVVVDFKTSAGVYVDHILQLAAYQVALEEELNVKIPKRLIVRLDKKTGKFEPHEFPRDQRHCDAFLRIREVHESLSKIEDEL